MELVTVTRILSVFSEIKTRDSNLLGPYRLKQTKLGRDLEIFNMGIYLKHILTAFT